MKINLLKSTTKFSGTSVTLRERIMLAAFLWAIALIGAIFIWKQFAKENATARELQEEFDIQAIDLEKKPEIEEKLAVHLAKMESAEELEGATLQGLIDAVARQSNLTPSSIVPKNETKSGIQILSVRLTFNEAPMERLLVFEDRIATQKTPLFINRVEIAVSRGDSLRATYDIATRHLSEIKK